MKKTYINALCILIIVILAGSILAPAFYLGNAFLAGWTSGMDQSGVSSDELNKINDNNSLDAYVPIDICFNADLRTVISSQDSLMFDNGETYPLVLSRGTVMVPEEKWGMELSWLTLSLYILSFVLFVLLMIEFIKFIININKERIFVPKNVVRLRRFGWYLISIAGLRCAAGIIEDRMFSNLGLTLSGYDPSSYWAFPWGNLLIGLLALLMAQVWARGLEMKEENELTI